MNNRTPFYDHHLKLNAKMIDFGGWDMPVQYTTITEEHNAVRNAAGIFDISHMGQVYVWGPGAKDFLQRLISNDIEKAPLGKGIYAHLLTPDGGVIDDIFVYHVEEEKFLLIINASRREVDEKWIGSQTKGFDVDVIEAPFGAGLAVQGPKAIDIINELVPNGINLDRFEIADLSFGDINALVGRTGYTGEDGVEIFAPAGHLLQIWDKIFKVGPSYGLKPAGLGARDTLRTEVSYPLYGHELDEDHTPFEAGLGWVVKLEKGDFIGRDALIKRKAAGIKTKLFGFKVESGGVARPGGKVFFDRKEIGTVCSGTFSPTLGYPIGMAYLPAATSVENQNLKIMQGERELSAVTVKMPFYKKPVSATK